MADFIDFYTEYVSGSLQMLVGFCLFVRLLQKKVRFWFYVLFTACAVAVLYFGPTGTLVGFGLYILLLMAYGILVCGSDWKPALLYAALVVESMQLCYGMITSLLSIFYPLMSDYDQYVISLVFILAGDVLSLLLTAFFCYMVYRHFSWGALFLSAGISSPQYEAIKKRYMLLALIPILMIFITNEYIHSFIYSMTIMDDIGITLFLNHYQMLVMQLLEVASLFCILFTYKKMLQNFRLSTELSLLEQEEHSLNQYVEEARTHYNETASFRHDIRNHITVMRKLLQSGKPEQALDYIADLDEMAEKMSFPCSTNNPVVDILAGSKLGIAKSMGIRVSCSLLLPYPCGLRDIDICIILSNALDNAIQACKNMEEGADKYIRVTGRIQGDFLLLEIENSFHGKGPFQKGTGLSNIKAVTEKYRGAMSTKTQDTVFLLNVLLIIPQHSESISRQMASSPDSAIRKRE